MIYVPISAKIDANGRLIGLEEASCGETVLLLHWGSHVGHICLTVSSSLLGNEGCSLRDR